MKGRKRTRRFVLILALALTISMIPMTAMAGGAVEGVMLTIETPHADRPIYRDLEKLSQQLPAGCYIDSAYWTYDDVDEEEEDNFYGTFKNESMKFYSHGGNYSMVILLKAEEGFTLPDDAQDYMINGEVLELSQVGYYDGGIQLIVSYSSTGHSPDGSEPTVRKATFTKNGGIQLHCAECDQDYEEEIPRASKVVISPSATTYNGKVHNPKISLYDYWDRSMAKGYQYKIASTPSGRKNVGIYTYKIQLIGSEYTGTKNVTMTIRPRSTSITKLYAARKAFTVKWSKRTTQVSGYQVTYSTSSKFKNAKTSTIKSYKITSKKITKLSAKKKYYVKVRTYKTVKGKKIYSSWSKVKTVKTK